MVYTFFSPGVQSSNREVKSPFKPIVLRLGAVILPYYVPVAELADALDLGSSAREGV